MGNPNIDHNKEVRLEYLEKFSVSDVPIPWQARGYDDPQLIKMLKKAIIRGRPVTDEDTLEFFPREKDAWY